MKVALALGGGGVKGLAHIGVIDCLEKSGFQIAAIAGTSIGGLVGAIYAAGYRPEEILSIIETWNPNRVYRRKSGDGPALLGYQGLGEMLTQILGEKTFAETRLPFACTAVELNSAREVYLNQGRLIDSILATIAIPGIFPPRRIGDAELIDGGVLDPVPVRLARLLAPRLPVIAVVLHPASSDWQQIPKFNLFPAGSLPIPTPLIEGFARMRFGQALQIFARSLDITSRMLAEVSLEVDHPDVIIRPDVHQYGILDQVDLHGVYEAGVRSTEAALADVRRAQSWPSTVGRILRMPSALKRQAEQEKHSLNTANGATHQELDH